MLLRQRGGFPLMEKSPSVYLASRFCRNVFPADLLLYYSLLLFFLCGPVPIPQKQRKQVNHAI